MPKKNTIVAQRKIVSQAVAPPPPPLRRRLSEVERVARKQTQIAQRRLRAEDEDAAWAAEVAPKLEQLQNQTIIGMLYGARPSLKWPKHIPKHPVEVRRKQRQQQRKRK